MNADQASPEALLRQLNQCNAERNRALADFVVFANASIAHIESLIEGIARMQQLAAYQPAARHGSRYDAAAAGGRLAELNDTAARDRLAAAVSRRLGVER
ncbi:MAG TPA: hypothetical protein VGF34_04760 [Stellaceae bacterium]|jgi:hypothetical protein